MKREIGWNQIEKNDQSLVTVGTFDGVHLGHQSIIKYLVDRAKKQDALSVAVSFDPHPRQVVKGEAIPLLSTIEERATAFEKLGLDRFIVIPFTKDFANTSAEEFVVDILVNRIGLKEIIIGHDHGFGKGREGDKELLASLGKDHSFAVDVIPAQELELDIVSSTRIRSEIQEKGNVALVTKLLGRPYSLSGSVVEGDGRGATIGFPTANIKVNHPQKIVPMRGVYAVLVHLFDGRARMGMLNIGNRPTFDGEGERIEVHIFDLDESLYGQDIRVEFVRRIREEKKFNSVEALVQQLSKDKVRCRAELESVI